MRELLSIRDARLYLAGQALSLFGDTALIIALMIWARELTGSSSAAGLVLFAMVAPSLATPLAGLLVDRVRRRPLLIVANLLSAAAVLPLLAVGGAGQLWLLYAVAVAYGISYAVIGTGQSALLATMLPERLLVDANGALQTIREGLRLVAPLAGAALLAAFGGTAVALLDAATFVAAAAALAAMRLREPRPGLEPAGAAAGASAAREPRFAALAAGARHIAATPALRQVTLACAAALLVIGFCETVCFEIVDRGLHRPPSFLGVLLAVQGVGAVLGGLSAARIGRRVGERALVGTGMAIFAAGCLVLTASSLPVVLAGVTLFGFGLPWILVGLYTLIQRQTPAHLQGRAFGAVELLVGTPQTISIALGAVLVGFVDYRLLLLAIAVVVAGAGAYLLTRQRAPRARPHAHPLRAGGPSAPRAGSPAAPATRAGRPR